MNQTFTLTFSESVENHTGMQIIGNKASKGFSEDLVRQLAKDYHGELIQLNSESLRPDQPEGRRPDACICIFRNGLKELFDIEPNEAFKEQEKLEKDKKAFMYGRVVNKLARHNLCFADFNQDPEYEHGKGTIVDFARVPVLQHIRDNLLHFGSEFEDLYAEGNYYYDIKKTYIGWHGDTERSKVIGVRLGADFPLHFRWYRKGKAEGDIKSIILNSGDIYIMSQKATGNDWKRRTVEWTLRHSAGALNNLKSM
jgi:alkylated DNA repair dioxygenase AlkB